MAPKANYRAKLAELRAARESGKKTFDNYKVQDADSLYEEVDEDGYKKIVRDRLDQDDFVVDDNGEGYADDGREEWDRMPVYDDDSDSEEAGDVPPRGRQSKASKKQRENEQAARQANDQDISQFFNKAPTQSAPKTKIAKTKADDDFMNDLLGDIGANIKAPVARPVKRERSRDKRRTRDLSPAHALQFPAAKKKKVVDDHIPSPSSPVAGSPLDDVFAVPHMDDDDAMVAPSDPILPSSPPARDVAVKRSTAFADNDDDDGDYDMEVSHAVAANIANVNIASSRPVVKKEPVETPSASVVPTAPDAKVDSSSWNRITDQLNVISGAEPRPIGKLNPADVAEEDGSLNFFWTDYTEINGSLCLFGKVRNKKTRAYGSCFVKIDSILRTLYFLPRTRRVRFGQEMEEEVGIHDVQEEVSTLIKQLKAEPFSLKTSERKYAFELPGIPEQATYVKVRYPYTKPAVDTSTAAGETFSHVFGTNTALFEQFVLWKNIMGPCWLKIKSPDFEALKNASHCKMDVLVSDPGCMSTSMDDEEPPPLTLMSMAMRTVFNAKENKQEILAVSARVYENVSLSDTTPAEKLPCRQFTLVRPSGDAFPFGFDTLARKRSRGTIRMTRQENELLAVFLAQLDLADPDVILGHQLEGVDYSILLNRLHEKKVPQWSRIGRFRRTQWPASIGRVANNVFAERSVMAGRLLCDLSNDCGKSTMYKCTTWSLTEMCELYLSADNKRREVDNEVALKTWATTKDGLMDYIAHLEADTYFITALALRVQLLPLTQVLTNLAGNSWARTLTGTRAERNEYILLHEFHRNKYICPDKQGFVKGQQGKQKQSQSQQQQQQQQQQRGNDDEDEENGGAEGAKKKDRYKGGLVFEPEKGLYDKFVLVMDFNSLYPSIIQEFNICFTTVERSNLSDDNDDGGVPEVPMGKELGILPRLISTLVQRRRQVKNLMKDKSATPEQLATWDIRQLALKLTANSMYGCLGYTKSRFYARPLAVLTTFKGREILRSTKELAESNALQVIYGDTDSVMINANADSVADALKVGNEFKKAVNDRYKLLEIDIDGIFRRILLQAKKKYAAVSLVEHDGQWVEKMEVKGLDMKRREYCALSKEVSARLLQEILSGNDSEVSVARMHEYLRDVAAKMRAGEIPLVKYTIFTQLGKAPKEYPNADSMPQVQVALRELARGKTVRRGDVIGYIITGDGQSSEPAPKRAYTPADVRTEPGLAPDVEWYIGKQIFPPVERLCANIVGTSTMQLGEQLGLDVKKYSAFNTAQGGGGGGGNDAEMHPLESQVADEVRFGECTRIAFACRACKASTPFEGLVGSAEGVVTPDGIACGACGALAAMHTLAAQLEHAVRAETTRYYEGWVVCDDPSCGNRTRQIGVYGTRCLGPKGLGRECLGRMRYQYSEKAVYTQLVYMAGLFDVDRARAKVAGEVPDATVAAMAQEGKDRIVALAAQNRVRFGTLKDVVDRYLDKCGRQWVAMDSLFARLGFLKT